MEHYWDVPSDETMLATLLDSRCKAFFFMLRSLKKRIVELLKAEYEEVQILYRTEEKKNNLQTNPNTLLASIFQNRSLQLEVSDYFGLAQKYLAIPATSTASKRLFSDTGNIIIAKRTSLLPTTFEHL
ncbi:25516_t:CDS:2, partial [Racocetra persica]